MYNRHLDTFIQTADAGQLIYAEAKKMIRHSNTVLRKARELEKPKKYVIRVGVSLMNPASNLLERHPPAAGHHPPGLRLYHALRPNLRQRPAPGGPPIHHGGGSNEDRIKKSLFLQECDLL